MYLIQSLRKHIFCFFWKLHRLWRLVAPGITILWWMAAWIDGALIYAIQEPNYVVFKQLWASHSVSWTGEKKQLKKLIEISAEDNFYLFLFLLYFIAQLLYVSRKLPRKRMIASSQSNYVHRNCSLQWIVIGQNVKFNYSMNHLSLLSQILFTG